ncbi:MAG: serine hydrolase [Candidatus Aminicenantes bacterium]|nr:serine hydrolase [Candidatus Aminicenantes bacterium]
MKKKGWLGAFVLGIGLIAPAAPLAAAPANGPDEIPAPSLLIKSIEPADLETFVDGVMAAELKAGPIAGATFVFVKDGSVLLAKGYGYADVKKRKPVVAEETLFRPGSVSKLFTWTAVMQLVEQGKLSLNADVNTYLQKSKIPETFPEPVTLAHLMAHTAGFEEVLRDMGARTPADLIPLEDYLVANMPARVYPPGKIAAYSNYGTALAGYVVQVVSGMPFEEYVEDHIFRPLGMNMSTFREPLPSHLERFMSVGYSIAQGVLKAEDFELINGLYPAGSLSTTATDLARFMIAHLQDGRFEEARILQEETARQMHSRLFGHDSLLDGNAHGFWEKRLNGIRMIEHGGDTVYFHSQLVLVPEHNLGMFVSLNTASSEGDLRGHLLQSLLDRYFPVPDPPEPEPPAGFTERAGKLTGHYKFSRVVHSSYEKLMALGAQISVKITPDNTLLTSFPMGLDAKQWIETAPYFFEEIGGPGTLMFKEDDSGKVRYLYVNEYPIMAGIRTEWHQTPSFHIFILGVISLVFLSVLRWPLAAIFGRICRRKRDERPAPRTARWTAGLMVLLQVVFIVGLTLMLSDIEKLMYGVPLSMKILLGLPVVSVLFLIGTFLYMAAVWFKGYWTGCARVHYTLVFLAGLAFLLILNYWNLLGWKF